MSNQCVRILSHLREYGSITNRDAFVHYSITSFTRRICDLKASGVNIVDRWEVGNNKFNEPCRYKRYFLVEDKKSV